MSSFDLAHIPLDKRPRLIIDADLYPRLLALAERALKQLPALAERLLEEIERADLRPSHEIPSDVVTLGSEVVYRDGDRTETVRIVAPAEADIGARRISVLTPVGAALLGLAKGQRIAWGMPNGRTGMLEVLDVRPAEEQAAVPH
ncbi:MAG TPA: nucleoside diphosphate kinase regulator [Gammaproteobacteria bacterium]|jgi:regulator of nucleoside diphosphate kinase|nr:nucleoside diphosphate kinase regulator [Gammaproteobacteria bacterium]